MSVQPGCHAAALATRGGEVKRRGKRKPYTQELNTRSTRPKKPVHHKHSNKHGHENIHSLKMNITKPTVRESMAKGAARDPQLQHFNRDRPARDIPGNQPPFPSPLFQNKTPKPQTEMTGNTLLNHSTHICLQLTDVTLASDYPRGGVSQPHIIIINHSRDNHWLGPA